MLVVIQHTRSADLHTDMLDRLSIDVLAQVVKPLPALPKSSDRALPTQELGNLFWGGIHSALQPAAMDEQWMAVRRLLTVA